MDIGNLKGFVNMKAYPDVLEGADGALRSAMEQAIECFVWGHIVYDNYMILSGENEPCEKKRITMGKYADQYRFHFRELCLILRRENKGDPFQFLDWFSRRNAEMGSGHTLPRKGEFGKLERETVVTAAEMHNDMMKWR